MRTHPLIVQVVDVEEIQQHPDNANNGDVDLIEESIEINGFYKPLFVQRSTGYILIGNHTYLAAYRQRAKQVPVIYLDVDDVAAKRIMVADNATNRAGFDDEAQLANVLSELRDSDLRLLGTGHSDESYERLMGGLDEPLDFDAHPVADDRLGVKNGLHVTVTPLVNEDGAVYEFTIEKEGFGALTKTDYQAVRKALGLSSASKADIAAFAVPQWR